MLFGDLNCSSFVQTWVTLLPRDLPRMQRPTTTKTPQSGCLRQRAHTQQNHFERAARLIELLSRQGLREIAMRAKLIACVDVFGIVRAAEDDAHERLEVLSSLHPFEQIVA